MRKRWEKDWNWLCKKEKKTLRRLDAENSKGRKERMLKQKRGVRITTVV